MRQKRRPKHGYAERQSGENKNLNNGKIVHKREWAVLL